MFALVLTNKGLEKVSAQEIESLLNVKVNIFEGYLTFEISKRADLYKLAYLGRSFTKVLEIISTHESPFDLDFNLKFDKEKTIGIEVMREGEHKFNSEDLFKISAGKIKEQGYEIDQKNPSVPLFLFVKDNNSFLCVDYCGCDLGRRDYHMFINKDAIKGNVAAGILLMSGFHKGSVLDPFCRDGVFMIESALMAKNQSVHYFNKEKFAFLKIFDEDVYILDKFDKNSLIKSSITASDTNFANLSSAKKNATIADVLKDIKFLRCDIENLDLKFDKIDLVVTMPLQIGRSVLEKTVRNVGAMFFKRVKEISGKIVLVVKRGLEIYEELAKGFTLIDKKEIMQGQQKITVLIFEKD